MNLDEQLRAALTLEADMQTAPQPDVQDLIDGGKVRRRRRTATRIGIGIAAAVVLIGGSAYAVTQLDSEPRAVEPAEHEAPAAYIDTTGADLEPGAYRVAVAPGIAADLTFAGPMWSAAGYPFVTDGVDFAGVGVYQPVELAAGSGCTGSWRAVRPASTATALANQLARLPQSTVVQSVTSTQVSGHPAQHLQLLIDPECPANEGYVALEAASGSRGLNYPRPRPLTIDFWVVDVDGTPVVLDTWSQLGAPEELVDTATETSESVSFVTD